MKLPLFDMPPAEARRKTLEIIAAHGSSAPASIAYIQMRTGANPRQIKAIVEAARIDGAPICARRGKPCGYFWAATAEELETSAQTMKNQALQMLVAAGRLVGKHRLREMLGQISNELMEASE